MSRFKIRPFDSGNKLLVNCLSDRKQAQCELVSWAVFQVVAGILFAGLLCPTLVAQDGNRLLFVHGHPDDEGIFGGGVLPYYSQVADHEVISMGMVTRNANGRDPLMSGNTSRITELRNAIKTYAGVSAFQTNPFGHLVAGNITMVEGGYIDTGCCGADPIDTWSDAGDGFGWGTSFGVTLNTPGLGNVHGLSDARFAAAFGIAKEIRRYRPEVIVTPHDLEGDYGHSNHTATAIAVIDAFTLAGDSSIDIAGLDAWEAQKLYLRGDENDNRAGISWDGFTSNGGINSLFHEGFNEASIDGLTPLEVADLGLAEHASQGQLGPSTVFIDDQRFEGHHSEWWTLYASRVGQDHLESPFTVQGDKTGRTYTHFARGDFFQNISSVPEPSSFAALILMATGCTLRRRCRLRDLGLINL